MKRVLNLFVCFAVFALLAVNVHAEIGDNFNVNGLRVAEDDEVIVESSITVYGTIGTSVYSSIDAALLAVGLATGTIATPPDISELRVATGALDTAKLDKSSATATYLQLNGKAADSELLDGLDSLDFQLDLATTSWTAYDSDNLGGVAAADYAADSDVEALETRCDDLDTSTETLTHNLSALETRVDNIDITTATLTDATTALGVATGTIAGDLADFETRVQADTDTIRSEILAVGIQTGTISGDLAQVKVDTGTLGTAKLDASSATASYVHIRGDDAIDGDKDFSGDVTVATATIFVANIGTTLEMNPFLGGAVQEGKIDWGSVERRVSWSDTYGAINTSTNVRVAGNLTLDGVGVVSGMAKLKLTSIDKATAQSTTPTTDELGCIYYLTDGSNQVYCIISTGTVAGGFATVGDGSIDWN